MMTFILRIALCVCVFNSSSMAVALELGGGSGRSLEVSRVAVTVFPQGKVSKQLVRSAQSRMEGILADNGVEVIDRDESEKLKDVWTRLEDPAHFVTAEEFLENAAVYQIDGIVRVYLSAEVTNGLGGFYSATAQSDVRFVGEDANVAAFTSVPMGTRGRPPSDGLTKNAALLNAVQRSIDEAAGELKLELFDVAKPRSMRLALEGPINTSDNVPAEFREAVSLSADFVEHANLSKERWSSEKATCAARSPGGGLGAVGTRISELNRQRRKIYGSKLHVVDLDDRKKVLELVTNPVELKDRKHRGDSAVLDCMFLTSWRYLAATTGDVLSLWDTERGVQLSETLLPKGLKRARLEFVRDSSGDFLRVFGADKASYSFKITRAK